MAGLKEKRNKRSAGQRESGGIGSAIMGAGNHALAEFSKSEARARAQANVRTPDQIDADTKKVQQDLSLELLLSRMGVSVKDGETAVQAYNRALKNGTKLRAAVSK